MPWRRSDPYRASSCVPAVPWKRQVIFYSFVQCDPREIVPSRWRRKMLPGCPQLQVRVLDPVQDDNWWWDHPALIWDENNDPIRLSLSSTCSNDEGSVYWNIPSQQHCHETAATARHEHGCCCSLSYDVFFRYTIELARQIRSAVVRQTTSVGKKYQEKSRLISVPVAVAIPEGPFLPLAIAAVHALNAPYPYANSTATVIQTEHQHETTTNMMLSNVLLPLDPSDGRERLLHMLREAHPVVILTASDSDTRLFQELLTILTTTDTDTHDEDESITACKNLSDNNGKVAFNVMDDPLLHRSSSDIQVVLNVSELLHRALLRQTTNQLQSSYLQSRHGYMHHQSNQPRLLDQLNDFAAQATGTPLWLDNNVEADGGASLIQSNRISHLVYTSGTTGRPKGCLSSIQALQHYLTAKNRAHGISCPETVPDSGEPSCSILLASALTFDPCLSDVLATLQAHATLALAPRQALLQNLPHILQSLRVTHVLCTPTLWSSCSGGSGSSRKDDDEQVPPLRVVALGGEKILSSTVQAWARRRSQAEEVVTATRTRLCATFGVTEACVYQTFGEVFVEDVGGEAMTAVAVGQDVGLPLDGMNVRICDESRQDRLVDVTKEGAVGEVVLSGKQLDALSSHLHRPDLTAAKFIQEKGSFHYRTGDRGFLHPVTGHLHILGRIVGEDGMVKFNGVRVELGEIEMALVDQQIAGGSDASSVVLDAIIVPVRPDENSSTAINLVAYVVLERSCLDELGVSAVPESGLLVSDGPLLLLLRARCQLRARIAPSFFVVLPRIPLSPTGKRSRNGAPPVESAELLVNSLFEGNDATCIPLAQYGRTGQVVAREIIDCLNLPTCQSKLLTTSATFGTLGGDSLGATRVVRAIFAIHNGVMNTRFLGGEFGTLGGPFDVVYLLSAKNLGAYVDWLDSQGVCEKPEVTMPTNIEPRNAPESSPAVELSGPTVSRSTGRNVSEASDLYDALLQAVSVGLSSVAMALLDVGVDPNYGEHGGRLGKTSGRLDRKKVFRTSPLHLACLQGKPDLVRKLLQKKAKFNSPDASGLFPIHLAAAGEFNQSSTDSEEEDCRRLICLQCLLEAGAPVSMKDGSNQSVLHAAARSGHCKTLRYSLEQWVAHVSSSPKNKDSLDWRDKWSRTPVHWAVLNGKVDALDILLEMGCDPCPLKPKESQKRTSAAAESPLEMCERVHGDSLVGKRIRELLQSARTTPKSMRSPSARVDSE